MITARDRDIYRHLEAYNFASIEHISKIFFKEQKYGYDIARKRLNKLVDMEYIKRSKNMITNQLIYFLDPEYRKVSLHSMLLMDFYTELVYCNAEIVEFQKEKEWMDGKVRSDALAVYDFNGYRFFNLIEVHTSNNKINLEKYEELYNTGELQKKYGTFPTIVLIDDINHRKAVELPHIEVVHLNFNLDNFASLFM